MNERRKELLREYKETPRPSGVFAVRNTVDDRLLLGASPNLPGMLNRQQFQLRDGCHPDKRLQADWDRLGPDAFEFEVLDEIEPSEDPQADLAEELDTLLAMWVDRLGVPEERRYRGR